MGRRLLQVDFHDIALSLHAYFCDSQFYCIKCSYDILEPVSIIRYILHVSIHECTVKGVTLIPGVTNKKNRCYSKFCDRKISCLC